MSAIDQIAADLEATGGGHAAVVSAVHAALCANPAGPAELRLKPDGTAARQTVDATAPDEAPTAADALTLSRLLCELDEFLENAGILVADTVQLGEAVTQHVALEAGRVLIRPDDASADGCVLAALVGARHAAAGRELVGLCPHPPPDAALHVVARAELPFTLLICGDAQVTATAFGDWHVQQVKETDEVQTALAAACASNAPAAIRCTLTP